jgi:hypothetical protein
MRFFRVAGEGFEPSTSGYEFEGTVFMGVHCVVIYWSFLPGVGLTNVSAHNRLAVKSAVKNEPASCPLGGLSGHCDRPYRPEIVAKMVRHFLYALPRKKRKSLHFKGISSGSTDRLYDTEQRNGSLPTGF